MATAALATPPLVLRTDHFAQAPLKRTLALIIAWFGCRTLQLARHKTTQSHRDKDYFSELPMKNDLATIVRCSSLGWRSSGLWERSSALATAFGLQGRLTVAPVNLFAIGP
eukprot:3565613-Amphidinium_carterae.1